MALYKATSSTKLSKIAGVTEATGLINPNLLHNGDFQIWQQGEEFTNCINGNYYPDRWRYYGENITSSTLKKIDGGLEFENTKNDEGWAVLYQPLEQQLFDKIKGKTVTLSYLENDMLKINTFVVPNNWKRDLVTVTITTKDTDITTIKNVKLELGSISTTFVPRQYDEELKLCKQYYRIYNPTYFLTIMQGTYYDNVIIGFMQMINLARNPIITFIGSLTYFGIPGKSNIIETPSSITCNHETGVMTLTPSSTLDLVSGTTCLVQMHKNSKMVFDANIY